MFMLMSRSVTKFLCLASFFLFFSGGVANALDSNDLQNLDDAGTFRVEKVIDPLTIQLDNKELVSLVGLDIPDFNPHSPGPIATLATDVLKDYMLNEEMRVYRTKNRNTGRSNRMGHRLYHLIRDRDNGWVQGTMLKTGLARVRTTKDNPELAAAMYAAEDTARRDNLGLWAMPDYPVFNANDEENANKAINSFSVLRGTVRRAMRKQSRIYINFGRNWRKDFTIQIPSSDLRSFQKKNMDPLNIEGKMVEVRGWVKDYNGPYIEIDHPERLRILDAEK